MITPERIFIVVGSIVVVLLQLLVAPYIGVFFAVPNFLLAFAVALAVVRAQSFGCILPFVLGLVFDIVGGGPLGAMACALTVSCVLASRLFTHVDNDSLFMALAVVALGVLVAEVLYAVIMLLLGYPGSFGGVLVYRVVPCFLYDLVVSFVMYAVAVRFGRPATAVRTELTILR